MLFPYLARLLALFPMFPFFRTARFLTDTLATN